jgi:hypothetical protein
MLFFREGNKTRRPTLMVVVEDWKQKSGKSKKILRDVHFHRWFSIKNY